MKRDVENAADARMPGDAAEDGRHLAKAVSSARIKIKKSKAGSLHTALGVPQGQKIPAGKIASAANSSNPNLKRKAVFAKNAAGWKH